MAADGTTEMESIDYSKEELRSMDWTGTNTDWFLQKLVKLANSLGLEVGITLSTPAGIVSGTLISGDTYFKAFAQEFADAWPFDDAEEIRNGFEKLGAPSEGTVLLPAQYIHLKDAHHFHSNGKIPSDRGVFWRGKISSVSGFTLGRLS